MSSPLNAQLLAAQDSARAAALRQSGATAPRFTPSASSEETALQFKQMLNKLDVAAAAPKPTVAAAAAPTPSSPAPANLRPATPDRSAERLAERRIETQSQDQKLAARRAQNQAGAKAAGAAERQVLNAQTPSKAGGSDSGAEFDRSSASTRKPAADERSSDTAAAAKAPATAEPSTPRSDTQAWNGQSREQAQPEDEAEDSDSDALAIEAARGGRPSEMGELDATTAPTAARPDGSRSLRRDSIPGASDLGSRRASTVDRAQAQVFGKDLNATGANPAATGAAGTPPLASSEGSNFARMLQGAGANPDASSPAPAALTAAQAATGLDALSRSQATDATAPASANSSSAESAQLHLQSPLHAPAFAPELGARLSVLAADGVQEAQLHLNPAEMGPVQVQIVLEGQQAQISFHAEHAETRRVLEQSLPDLAAALRDSGLTLSGGGVFQQARDSSGQTESRGDEGRRADGRGSRREMRVDGAGSDLAASPGPMRRSQGVVDLYA